MFNGDKLRTSVELQCFAELSIYSFGSIKFSIVSIVGEVADNFSFTFIKESHTRKIVKAHFSITKGAHYKTNTDAAQYGKFTEFHPFILLLSPQRFLFLRRHK